MRLEEVLQQMEPEDVDDVKYHLDQYALNGSKENGKELWKCIKHIKKSYPIEIYTPILKIYSTLVNMNDDK